MDDKYIQYYLEGCEILGLHPRYFLFLLLNGEMSLSDYNYVSQLKLKLEKYANGASEEEKSYIMCEGVYLCVMDERISEGLLANKKDVKEFIENAIICMADNDSTVSNIRKKRKLYSIEDYAQYVDQLNAIEEAYDSETQEVYSLIEGIDDSCDELLINRIKKYVSLIEDLSIGEIALGTFEKNIICFSDYFNWYESQLNIEDSIDSLNRVVTKYAYVKTLCLFVLWKSTKDKVWLDKLIEDFDFIYSEGDICIHHDEIYWSDEARTLNACDVNRIIKEWCLAILQLRDNYLELLNYYLDNRGNVVDNKDSFYQEVSLEMDDPITSHMYDANVEAQGGFENWLVNNNGYNTNPEESRHLTREEYFDRINNLTDKERYEAGEYCHRVLYRNIEIINITKILLLEMANENEQYKPLLFAVSKALDEFISVEYKCSVEYEEQSVSKIINDNVEEYSKEKRFFDVVDLFINMFRFVYAEDIEQLMQCKKYILSTEDILTLGRIDELEKVINLITDKIEATCSKKDDFIIIRNKLIAAYKDLQNELIDTLSTAEYLYKEYILDKEPDEHFDYSSISILYYQVIEKLLNIKFFIPYATKIRPNINEQNSKSFFKDPKFYGKYKKGGKYSPNNSIEIGPLGYLLKNIGAVEEYKTFVTELYPKANVENITAIGEDIVRIKDRRNDAAHSKILDYSTVQEDKYIVFHNNDSLSFAIEIHDLFNRILDIVE